jgi:hypothetical protein
MRALDDDGGIVEAGYQVENDAGRLALVLASVGGASGSRPPRNPRLPAGSCDIIDNNNFNGPETVNLSGAYAFEICGPCPWYRTGP